MVSLPSSIHSLSLSTSCYQSIILLICRLPTKNNTLMYFLPFQVHYICCRFPVSPSTWMCVRNLFHNRTVFKGVQIVTLSKM